MEEQLLQNRFIELAERSYNSGCYTYTNFLNLMELDMLSRMESRLRHVPHMLWGGAEDCERKLVRFGNYETCGYEEEVCLHPYPGGKCEICGCTNASGLPWSNHESWD